MTGSNSPRREPSVAARAASFETCFAPDAQLVSAVRRFASDFYVGVIGENDRSSRLALATHELLDNAVRYCNCGVVTIRVSVSTFRLWQRVRVQTRNAATPAHTANLRWVIAQIEAEPDPAAYYQRRMRESLDEARRSGLGLARSCAELRMKLECTTAGSDVEIDAQVLLGAADTGS